MPGLWIRTKSLIQSRTHIWIDWLIEVPWAPFKVKNVCRWLTCPQRSIRHTAPACRAPSSQSGCCGDISRARRQACGMTCRLSRTPRLSIQINGRRRPKRPRRESLAEPIMGIKIKPRTGHTAGRKRQSVNSITLALKTHLLTSEEWAGKTFRLSAVRTVTR